MSVGELFILGFFGKAIPVWLRQFAARLYGEFRNLSLKSVGSLVSTCSWPTKLVAFPALCD
jgi:hypothetical protein